MRFSQRIGKTPVKVELEREGLNLELRNLLWNPIAELGHNRNLNCCPKHDFHVIKHQDSIETYLYHIWVNFLTKTIDDIPIIEYEYQDGSFGEHYNFNLVLQECKKYFYDAQWYKALDLIEEFGKYFPQFKKKWNAGFEQEMSAYRFVNDKIVQIDSKEEIAEIEQAINDNDQFNTVKIHLETALTLMSNCENPDYRNSIKESISAIESIVKKIINDDKATLGQALKRVQERHNLPKALQKSFEMLYGYTSDEGGIRHALTDDSIEVTYAEARFMLIACSAFINLIKLKEADWMPF